MYIVRVVKSRWMRWAEHVARMGEDRGVYRVLVGKPEGKRPLGRPRRRWEDNIKIDLQKVRGVVGTGWSWLRIGTGGGHLWVRWGTFGFHKCGEFLDYLQSLLVSFSRRTLLHGVRVSMYIGLHIKYALFLLIKLEFSRQAFKKSSYFKFLENPSSGNWAFPSGKTDGRTDGRADGQIGMTKLMFSFAVLRTHLNLIII
jgi:hypothetical protein